MNKDTQSMASTDPLKRVLLTLANAIYGDSLPEGLAEEIEKIKTKTSSSNFIVPTDDEVITYFQSRGDIVDPKRAAFEFTNFYGSKGWMVGKSKMKDWKMAAARAANTWDSIHRKSTIVVR
jgi:hypothetical protein